MTKRRNFSDNFKASVALEALRGDKSAAQNPMAPSPMARFGAFTPRFLRLSSPLANSGRTRAPRLLSPATASDHRPSHQQSQARRACHFRPEGRCEHRQSRYKRLVHRPDLRLSSRRIRWPNRAYGVRPYSLISQRHRDPEEP